MVENRFRNIVKAAPPFARPKVAEGPASRQPDAPAKHEPILAKNGAAEVPKVNKFSLDSLESFETFAEKKELEPKESYEESLDRAIEALKDTEGIVELKNQDVPTIVISDLHARRDFLANVLSQKDRDGKTVLELLKAGKINVICLGDGMHSEDSKNWNVFDPNPEKGEGHMELNPKKLEKEMVASLGLMKMVMDLKSAFPDAFHYVRGNHDDISGEISGFMKYVPEEFGGESGVVKWWTKHHFGQDLLKKWAEFESLLPLVVKGKGFVASHTVPEMPLTNQQINSRDKNAAWQLLWTDNTEFSDLEPGPQQIFQENLKNLGAADSVWIIGHRKAFQRKYRHQFNGRLIQINSSQKQIVAVLDPSEAFNPEKNIFDLKSENAAGLETAKPKNITFRDLISPEQIEWIEALGEEAQEAYDLVVQEMEKKGEIGDITDEEIISGRVKPYLKKIFRLKILGERGFTKEDREYVIQAAVSKIKFNRPKAL